MARNKQQLINYHTPNKTTMPQVGDVEFGEIVVRHHEEAPELMIKVSSGTSETYGEYFAKFVDEKSVDTKIQASITTSQGNLEAAIQRVEENLAAASATVTNNYWTSAVTETKIGAASGYSLDEAKKYADQQDDALSGRIITHVQTAITDAITGDVRDIKSDISGLKSFSGKVESDYATKAEVNTAKDEAVTSAYTASNAYTDAEILKLSAITSAYVASQLTDNTTDISTLKSQMTSVSGSLVSLSAKVESDYATKEFVGVASGYAYNQAKTEVIGAATDTKDADTVYGAKAYADDKVKALSGDVIDYIDTQISSQGSSIESLDEKIGDLSGTVGTMSGEVKSYIDEKLTTVYVYQGSVATVADLPDGTGDSNKVGDVYNVVAANGQPGDADYTPAGTNYAWNGTAWDALGGTVDLSNYATTNALASAVTRIETLESASETAGNNIGALSGAVSAFSATIVNNYSTTEQVDSKIGAASAAAVTSAYTSSTAYTDEQIAILSGISSAYTDQRISTLQSSIDNILTGYAFSSITHQEIEDAKATVIGDMNSTSADTDTVKGLKLYSDEKDRLLQQEIADAMASLSGAVSGDFSSIQTQISALQGRVQENENKFTNSASTWNSALQHGELGEVSETAAGNGVTIQSGAKLKDDATNKKLVLDLTGLIIDCGDF